MVHSIAQTIIDQFSQQAGVSAILLFGSYATGKIKSDSDIDIAVLFEPQNIPSPMELWELKEKLAETLLVEVDLVCLNHADPIIANQIYACHQPILINNIKALQEYFMLLSSEYAELKEFIKPMEDRILERKYYAKRCNPKENQ